MPEQNPDSVRVSRALDLLVQASRVSPPLRSAVQAIEDLIANLRAENEHMKNALWKACGDDADTVTSCLEATK